MEGEVAIIREGAVLSPALGFEVLEVQPEAWLGTCPSILSTRMPGPSFSGFQSSYLLSRAFLYSCLHGNVIAQGSMVLLGGEVEKGKGRRTCGRQCPRASSEQ